MSAAVNAREVCVFMELTELLVSKKTGQVIHRKLREFGKKGGVGTRKSRGSWIRLTLFGKGLYFTKPLS